MNLFDLKETSEKTGVSRATIYRFYDKNPQLMAETKIKNKKRLIPEAHLPLITKTNIYSKYIKLDKEYTQLKKLVDVITVPDSLQYTLYQMGWDWFGTIAFKNEFNTKQSFHRMLQAYDHIIDLYGSKTDLRIFFTVEPFSNRKGTHIHFVLAIDNNYLMNEVLTEIKNYFIKSRIDLREYDKYKAGIYYISKCGLQGEDWDILGNNLPKKISKE